MKYSLLLVFILSEWILSAQNLIPNPGFDDIVDCPLECGQIYLAEPWVSATNSSPDLLNECSPEPFLQVPYSGANFDSYQLPRSGSGYAFIITYYSGMVGPGAVGFYGHSEYIEVPLKEVLVHNTQYYIEFFVSPDITPMSFWGYTEPPALTLTDTFVYKEFHAMEVLPLEPVIEERVIIKDTVGWTRISGCYTAKGTEKFAIIGNFRSQSETLTEVIMPTYPDLCFYYIEDVLIMPFDPLPDTLLLCDKMPVKINAGFLDATYLWNTGETDSIITIFDTGIYTVEAFMENCVLRDTVVVIDPEEVLGFPADTLICRDEPLRLSPPIPGEYHWSDGSEENHLIVSSSGFYEVTVTNECGEFIFFTEVEVKDCACNVFIPNAFSPNGDGVNDFLEAFVGCDFDYQIKKFGVFDRWGGQVYSSSNGETIKWNGTARGKDVPVGVYVWVLEYEVIRNGVSERRTEKGDVLILR